MGVFWIRLTEDSFTASRSASGSSKRRKTLHGNTSSIKAYGFGQKLALAA